MCDCIRTWCPFGGHDRIHGGCDSTPGGRVVGGVVGPTENHKVYQKGAVLHLLPRGYISEYIVSVNTTYTASPILFLI